MHLDYFENIDNFYPALKTLFEDLNIPVDYISEEPARPRDILTNTFKEANPAFKLMEDVYYLGIVDDAAFEGNKSIDTSEIKYDYDAILLFGVTLKERENGLLPTRSQLAEITRAFNREFHYTPVVVVFRYNQYIAFANAERQKYKQEWREGEKAGKVSLLRDVKVSNPHTGHLKILQELTITRTGRNAVDSFDKLYKYWQEVFNVSVLNREFYKELSNWYFWALKKVTFPGASLQADQNGLFKENERVKEHNAKNLIRLLTRLLFVWFVKEKGLIPEELFDTTYIKEALLKEFHPQRLGDLFEEQTKGSTYYKAVLQNLFFATLNQIRGKREFRKDKQHMNVTNLMRYESCLKNPGKFIKLVEDIVPFMNGGLFECLDQPDPELKGKRGGDVIIYQDGFSDRNDNKLVVPDYIFFGAEEPVDLREDYGSNNKACKEAPVRGLINILNSYKFTITENTPIEEDVALDPELLGRVFENLLASYNPETKTTARKQTGSFYTPREIVNYMVDESLIAYFKNKLSGDIEDADKLDTKLRQLISFDDIQPFQENKIKEKIIKAIDACSILDPACGSGAFPMGILQKMVHLLHKLDPGNEQWKQRQIDKVNEAVEKAEEIEDSSRSQSVVKELKEQIKDIEDSFENNELDYGRKLYLLENCIYGVDIQEIATQISKLRFFISLIVDQSVDKNKENFGIRPLPNLETKFVAANTLIGIEKPKEQVELFDNPEIKKLENNLKKIRHKLFSSKSPGRKRELRDEDKALREQIAELLIEGGWENKAARQLASWDPYDQNASSPFFDPERMFGIGDGFDIVIGNPPYGADIDHYIKLFNRMYPKTSKGFKDIFKYFFNCCIEKLVKESGVLVFITPNTFLLQPRYGDLRKLLLEYRIVKLINLGEEVFDAVVSAAISIISGSKDIDANIIKFSDLSEASKFSGDLSNLNYTLNNQKQYLETPNNIFTENIRVKKDDEELLKNIIDFKDAGINYQRINVGLADKGNSDLSRRLLYEGGKEDDLHVEYWKGVDIDNFYIRPNTNRYVRPSIKLNQNERVILNRNYFGIAPKLLWRQTAQYPITAIDRTGIWFGRSIQAGIIKETFRRKVSYEYLGCILNSNYIKDVYGNTVKEGGRVFPQVKLEKLKPLPIKIIPLEHQRPFVLIAKYIEFLKFGSIIPTVDFFERLIDAMVFELYFPDHMKEKEIDILKFVEQDLKEVLGEDDFEQLPDKQKENVIEKLHNRWSNPKSEIVKRMNSFAEKSPDILKPILESK